MCNFYWWYSPDKFLFAVTQSHFMQLNPALLYFSSNFWNPALPGCVPVSPWSLLWDSPVTFPWSSVLIDCAAQHCFSAAQSTTAGFVKRWPGDKHGRLHPIKNTTPVSRKSILIVWKRSVIYLQTKKRITISLRFSQSGKTSHKNGTSSKVFL